MSSKKNKSSSCMAQQSDATEIIKVEKVESESDNGLHPCSFLEGFGGCVKKEIKLEGDEEEQPAYGSKGRCKKRKFVPLSKYREKKLKRISSQKSVDGIKKIKLEPEELTAMQKLYKKKRNGKENGIFIKNRSKNLSKRHSTPLGSDSTTDNNQSLSKSHSTPLGFDSTTDDNQKDSKGMKKDENPHNVEEDSPQGSSNQNDCSEKSNNPESTTSNFGPPTDHKEEKPTGGLNSNKRDGTPRKRHFNRNHRNSWRSFNSWHNRISPWQNRGKCWQNQRHPRQNQGAHPYHKRAPWQNEGAHPQSQQGHWQNQGAHLQQAPWQNQSICPWNIQFPWQNCGSPSTSLFGLLPIPNHSQVLDGLNHGGYAGIQPRHMQNQTGVNQVGRGYTNPNQKGFNQNQGLSFGAPVRFSGHTARFNRNPAGSNGNNRVSNNQNRIDRNQDENEMVNATVNSRSTDSSTNHEEERVSPGLQSCKDSSSEKPEIAENDEPSCSDRNAISSEKGSPKCKDTSVNVFFELDSRDESESVCEASNSRASDNNAEEVLDEILEWSDGNNASHKATAEANGSEVEIEPVASSSHSSSVTHDSVIIETPLFTLDSDDERICISKKGDVNSTPTVYDLSDEELDKTSCYTVTDDESSELNAHVVPDGDSDCIVSDDESSYYVLTDDDDDESDPCILSSGTNSACIVVDDKVATRDICIVSDDEQNSCDIDNVKHNTSLIDITDL